VEISVRLTLRLLDLSCLSDFLGCVLCLGCRVPPGWKSIEGKKKVENQR